MKRGKLFLAMALGSLLVMASCDNLTDREVDIDYGLGDQFTLATEGPTTYVRLLDPESEEDFADHDEEIDSIKDPRFIATVINNSGCQANLSIYISYTLSNTVPPFSIKVAELAVPGPAGHQIEVDSRRIFSLDGANALNTYFENKSEFYVYFTIDSPGCAVSMTVLDPTLRITLKAEHAVGA